MRRALAFLLALSLCWFALLWLRREAQVDTPPPAAQSSRPPLSAGAAEPVEVPFPSAVSRIVEAPQTALRAPDSVAPEVDPDPPTEEVGPAPDDPIQEGECALELAVRDASSGEWLPGGVELWRLSAPGNENWNAGDQLQARAELEYGLRRFERLPEGRYRVRCQARRATGVDPPPFDVQGALTRIEVRIERPRRFRVLLDVRDETGLYLERATVSAASGSVSYAAPEWIQARSPRAGLGAGGIEGIEFGSRALPREIAAGQQGFEIGEFAEDTPSSGHSRHALLSVPGRSSVRCPIRFLDSDTSRFVGVSMPIEGLADRVRTADGAIVDRAQLSIDAVCTAVGRDSSADPQAWRQIPIRIQVVAPGYRCLVVDHRVCDGPIRELVLEKL